MKKEKSFFKSTHHILSLSKPQNILFSVLLCVCMLFASTTVFADEYTLVSGEYKNRVLVDDYMNEMKFSIPEHWKCESTFDGDKETRNYFIKTGTVLTTMFFPLPTDIDLTGNYSYANAVLSSLTTGLENYTEASRAELSVGNYPGIAVGYRWTSNSTEVTSTSYCISTNQGAYIFTFMMSSNNLDYDLLNDILNFTFSNIEAISYSEQSIIKEVQEKLNSLGYDCGTPDGIAGTGTQTAISNYRKDNNLSESTEINAELLSSLSRKVLSSDATATPNNSSTSSPLKDAEISTAPVKSGYGSTALGNYAFISVPKNILKTVTMEQFTDFANTIVKDSGYNWFSIMCDDGTGIQWAASLPQFATYGKIDSDKCVIETYGDITWDYDKETYSYVSK